MLLVAGKSNHSTQSGTGPKSTFSSSGGRPCAWVKTKKNTTHPMATYGTGCRPNPGDFGIVVGRQVNRCVKCCLLDVVIAVPFGVISARQYSDDCAINTSSLLKHPDGPGRASPRNPRGQRSEVSNYSGAHMMVA